MKTMIETVVSIGPREYKTPFCPHLGGHGQTELLFQSDWLPTQIITPVGRVASVRVGIKTG